MRINRTKNTKTPVDLYGYLSYRDNPTSTFSYNPTATTDILKDPVTGNRKPRKECKLCGGKMHSFQYSLCYHCAMKQKANSDGKKERRIETGNAILAIEKRKAEIKAAQRAKK